jgi:hypothetical protein
MATTQRSSQHRAPQTSGAAGRGAVSPLGGRSNPDQILRGGRDGTVIKTPITSSSAGKGQKPVTGVRGNTVPLT